MSTTRNVTEFATVVGIVGTCASQLMNLSALPSVYLIYTRKSTLLFPPFPFIFGLLAAFVGLTYAILTHQTIVIGSTCVTLTINLICFSVHLRYTLQRHRILKIFISLVLIEAIVTGIGPAVACGVDGIPECEIFVVNWVGVACTIVYSLVYCGQLTTFKQVIKSKNSASISPWLTGGVLFASTMWTWYSILVSDYYYLSSSIIGNLSALTQIILLIKYPSVQPTGNVPTIANPTNAAPPAIECAHGSDVTAIATEAENRTSEARMDT